MNLLDIVFPRRCVGCGAVGRYFCTRCRYKIRFVGGQEYICPVCEKPAIDGITHPRCKTRYSLDGLTSFFRYDGVIKRGIKAIKYRFVSHLASELITLISPASLLHVCNMMGDSATLIPIPLHASRFRFRGFNQAEILARRMGAQLNIPIKTDILRRTINTVTQVEMKDKRERLKNMQKAFTVQTSLAAVKNVVLFDDVFTTGATMRTAASMLKRNGVSRVWAVTIAR
jgi:ComF family protein